ncbi:T9SS type A sorting domain-containing protein [Flavobacteriales bacterium]|nr:T9SS type A sorting domain-containing protein [Flavobacteriales bacterium]MDB4088735.1 T9SS type A sorting domain-containing protein [Flavobacteriales bacterium]
MSSVIKTTYFKTPLGELVLGSYEEKLCLCDWRYRKKRDSIDTRIKMGLKSDFKIDISDVIEETIKQLSQYFKKERTDIKENEKTKSVLVYPNPLSYGEILNLNGIEKNDRVVIRDVTGKEIARYAKGIQTLKVDSYKKGMYFLSVYSKENITTVKFIVK